MIMISQGWTLTFGNLAEKDYFKMELGAVFGVHIFIGFLSVIDNGEWYKIKILENELVRVFQRVGTHKPSFTQTLS